MLGLSDEILLFWEGGRWDGEVIKIDGGRPIRWRGIRIDIIRCCAMREGLLDEVLCVF